MQWTKPDNQVPRAALFLLLAAALAATGNTKSSEADERVAAVERGLVPVVRIKGRGSVGTLLERMEHYHVPGVSVAVIDGGEIAWARAYGVADAESQVPVTTETLFQAASISKPIAALAALQLVEEGRLTLDGDVNDTLQTWKVPENDFTLRHAVTLRCLLSHTAGTTVHGFPGYAADARLPTLVEILDGVAPANTDAVRVDKLPGEGFRYSGGGTTIVQQLIEESTGRPFPTVMRERVLEPLGMSLSTYEQPLPEPRQVQAASAHRSNGKPLAGRWHVYPEMAAAGLWTTPSDLARYVIAVQDAYAGKCETPLGGELIAAMLTPQNGGPMGLGPQLSEKEGRRRFQHGGSNEGFRCMFVGDVEGGQGAVVMTNADGGGPLAREILGAVALAYGWKSFLPPERDVLVLDVDVLDRYVGNYALPNMFGGVAITRRDDRLFARPTLAPEIEIFFESPTAFFTDTPEISGEFVLDKEGSVESVVVQLGEQKLTATKKGD